MSLKTVSISPNIDRLPTPDDDPASISLTGASEILFRSNHDNSQSLEDSISRINSGASSPSTIIAASPTPIPTTPPASPLASAPSISLNSSPTFNTTLSGKIPDPQLPPSPPPQTEELHDIHLSIKPISSSVPSSASPSANASSLSLNVFSSTTSESSPPCSCSSTLAQTTSPPEQTGPISPLYDPKCLLFKIHSSPDISAISALTLAKAIDMHYSSPLPEVDSVFPWLHGLHRQNISQRAFLDPMKRFREKSNGSYGISLPKASENNESNGGSSEFDDSLCTTPEDVRGLMIVKIGDASDPGTLVGTVYLDEILCSKNTQVNDDDDILMNDSHDIDLDPSDLFIPRFLSLDPPDGISLRNFQIQVAKCATISDIVLYASGSNSENNLRYYAKIVALAQSRFRAQNPGLPVYKTFVLSGSIDEFIDIAPHVMAVPPKSVAYDQDVLRLKNWDSNFLFHERVEMSLMSRASPLIAGGTLERAVDLSFDQNNNPNSRVWLGNTADFDTYVKLYYSSTSTTENQAKNSNDTSGSSRAAEASSSNNIPETALRDRNWATFIECFDGASLPPISAVDQYIREAQRAIEATDPDEKELGPLSIQFPSSGSLPLYSCSSEDFYSIISLCKLIYLRSQANYGGAKLGTLIYCTDGYTETSLLALAYIIYSTGVAAPQAWLDLHMKYNRPFFCFPLDALVLLSIQPALLEYSPVSGSRYNPKSGADSGGLHLMQLKANDPWDNCEPWFEKLDASLPSRILSHMYLGSLVHAENPDMLAKLGIRRVLSVGEGLSWVKYDELSSLSSGTGINSGNAQQGTVYDNPHPGINKVMYVDNIQDDGVDCLSSSLTCCLDFLNQGYLSGEPTLVHCRVGVSRSATVCIAEVMKRLGVGLPRAYLFVRVRRLNVIIQPNLRFMYELMKWEEIHRRSGEGWLREVDWHILCREIANMNRAYIS